MLQNAEHKFILFLKRHTFLPAILCGERLPTHAFNLCIPFCLASPSAVSNSRCVYVQNVQKQHKRSIEIKQKWQRAQHRHGLILENKCLFGLSYTYYTYVYWEGEKMMTFVGFVSEQNRHRRQRRRWVVADLTKKKNAVNEDRYVTNSVHSDTFLCCRIHTAQRGFVPNAAKNSSHISYTSVLCMCSYRNDATRNG